MSAPFTIAALAAELAADPQGLGYAANTGVANDAANAALLNALTGNGAGTITVSTIDRNSFLNITTPAAVRLAVGLGSDNETQLSAGVVAKWSAVLAQARAADDGSQIPVDGISALGNPVTDLVMLESELAALTTRIGSRAEVLWGQGTVISAYQCSYAR